MQIMLVLTIFQADAELCILISEILEKCGLTKSDYTVKISSRKFTEELFDQLKIKSNYTKILQHCEH